MAALTLAPWQWGVLAAAYLLFFALPAVWMARRARKDGEGVFVWTFLVLVGSVLGIVEYYEHRAVLKRRARRGAAQAGTAEGTVQEPSGAARDELKQPPSG